MGEVARTSRELAAIGVAGQHLVINAMLPHSEVQHDPLAAAIVAREEAALCSLPVELRGLPRDFVPLLPFDLVGAAALRAMLCPAPDAMQIDRAPLAELDLPSLDALVDDVEADGRGLVMVMGKGGVGKTTLAAAVALELARRGHAVRLTTTDPAAHLAQTLAGSVEGLKVSRIDPHEETERYRAQVLATKGRDLDPAGRALLEEDLRSPCTEEIAVFHAFSGVIREAGRCFVVMDTAPTGHTLLLLDATGAYHRDVVRQLGKDDRHFVTPMMQLQDPRRTKVLIVTLAETTPVLEAAQLQADLRRAGIEPWAWVINGSLALARPSSPLLRQRARSELPQIQAVRTRHAARFAVLPMLAEEPIGSDRLAHLMRTAPALTGEH